MQVPVIVVVVKSPHFALNNRRTPNQLPQPMHHTTQTASQEDPFVSRRRGRVCVQPLESKSSSITLIEIYIEREREFYIYIYIDTYIHISVCIYIEI